MKSEASKAQRAGLPVHEKVYRDLRDAILFGEFEPGEPLTIQGLVARLDAGMTPVREALRRLTAEGALLAMGNRRIMVPVLDLPDVDELTEARLALEAVLTKRAVLLISEAEIAELAEIDARLDSAIERGDVSLYLKENHAFHARLNEIAQAPIMTALVDGLWLRFGPSLRVVCGQFGTRNLPDRHKELLTALQERDSDAAVEAIQEDVIQGMDLIRQSMQPDL
ncbi:HTH-type transcriptional regulator McbR [Pelagimonas phthalicica]|uniref:HTH-type transcriptional regulator McbR n=1 Tax=Pelagimonas phthalicica TaxID=1037362 RepID=A0A238J8Y7_9RHOB|nr:GntR family transcriptional regulator [Pelagimonas phthalicica]TDS94824.1 GntR family transcriptional regulator [Pelagimonas phthalicica]SMX26647.1 HTH-type transcriptional regulator McbR [Pelagimonas phthalicica]